MIPRPNEELTIRAVNGATCHALRYLDLYDFTVWT